MSARGLIGSQENMIAPRWLPAGAAVITQRENALVYQEDVTPENSKEDKFVLTDWV